MGNADDIKENINLNSFFNLLDLPSYVILEDLLSLQHPISHGFHDLGDMNSSSFILRSPICLKHFLWSLVLFDILFLKTLNPKSFGDKAEW